MSTNGSRSPNSSRWLNLRDSTCCEAPALQVLLDLTHVTKSILTLTPRIVIIPKHNLGSANTRAFTIIVLDNMYVD